MSDENRAGPGGLLEAPLWVLEEVVGMVPRLATRTRRQVELLRRAASHLPCVGGLVRPQERVRIPAAEAPPRVTVLDVVAEPGPSPDPSPAIEVPAAPAPEVVDLPVTDYDSLAASQVVPRLATLGHDELVLVDRYERANRNRQTILNRVAQLLAQ